MELKDGGLYQTKQGKRYRVFFRNGIFVCPSFGGYWFSNGTAMGKVRMDGKCKKPHLISEVDESRYVSVSLAECNQLPNSVLDAEYATDGRHWFKRVSLDEAKAMHQQPEQDLVVPDIEDTDGLSNTISSIIDGKLYSFSYDFFDTEMGKFVCFSSGNSAATIKL